MIEFFLKELRKQPKRIIIAPLLAKVKHDNDFIIRTSERINNTFTLFNENEKEMFQYCEYAIVRENITYNWTYHGLDLYFKIPTYISQRFIVY